MGDVAGNWKLAKGSAKGGRRSKPRQRRCCGGGMILAVAVGMRGSMEEPSDGPAYALAG